MPVVNWASHQRRRRSFGGGVDGGANLRTKFAGQSTAVAFQDGAAVGDVHHGLLCRGKPTLGEQLPVDIGACRREDVARWQFASLAEQGAQEGKGVGNVIVMQMHRGHGWAYLRVWSHDSHSSD